MTTLSLWGCNTKRPTKSWLSLLPSWIQPRRSPDCIGFLPPSISDDCTSLETLSFSRNRKERPFISLANCNRLAEIQGLENSNSAGFISMKNCSVLANNFKDSFFQFLGMTLWVVYACEEGTARLDDFSWAVICNKTREVEWELPAMAGPKVTREEHSLVSYIPKSGFHIPIKGGDRIEISTERCRSVKVKKCGIHLVCEPNITEEDRGQSSCLNADNRDELMDDMNLKRGRDVETSCDLSNEDKFHKRMRMEPDQTKNLDTELDQLKK
ncbi:hypothetical protein F0562_000046 [Nyssa sinensis]|uniref:Uncharacterized protein n=1 Tax=Nyssa sinensis TaxID=561372 RepID=A0A5J5C375_9ASTE|nr:hypothetical protein F0562_000046 [Nyssa sinensis]